MSVASGSFRSCTLRKHGRSPETSVAGLKCPHRSPTRDHPYGKIGAQQRWCKICAPLLPLSPDCLAMFSQEPLTSPGGSLQHSLSLDSKQYHLDIYILAYLGTQNRRTNKRPSPFSTSRRELDQSTQRPFDPRCQRSYLTQDYNSQLKG